jgi:hypothetical protein
MNLLFLAVAAMILSPFLYLMWSAWRERPPRRGGGR